MFISTWTLIGLAMMFAYLIQLIKSKSNHCERLNDEFESYQREVSTIIERSRELLDSEAIQELYHDYYDLLYREHDFIAEMMEESDYNADPEMCKRYYKRRLVAAKHGIENFNRELSFYCENLAVFPVER